MKESLKWRERFTDILLAELWRQDDRVCDLEQESKMSEWRPEGWGNPNTAAIEGGDTDAPFRFKEYEAGADAMLAALRDCTDSCHTGRGSFTRMAEYLSLFCNPGTLVFIPDEE